MMMMTESNRRLSVAVLEPQPIMAEGLRATLAASGRYSLLPPCQSLEELTGAVVTLSPRVAIVDKCCAISTLTSWLKQRAGSWSTAVVIWGSGIGESDALRLVNAGARGVLAKTAPAETLVACLDAVCQGATWMDDDLFQRALRREAACSSDLTLRERQVLELVEQGMRNKQIGAELGIQPGTVKIHMKHIFEKTGVRGRFGLALSAWRDRQSVGQATA
jgi:DNA-binding NarL/FixJ family response regulator